MRRTVPIAVLVVALAGGGLLWCRRGDDAPATDGVATSPLVRTGSRLDPKTVVRASITGTVRDERGVAIAGARVCGQGVAVELDDVLHEPSCTTTDRSGGYGLTSLYPVRYTVSAAARNYLPSVFVDGAHHELRLREGERRAGVDLVLRDGGVELVGSVADLTGGPIAKAQVWARDFTGGIGAVTPGETDDRGAFSLWVRPGDVLVTATAEGYAEASDQAFATTRSVHRVDLVLTPEASLAGTVVDDANQPIAGARVMVGTSDWGWESGEQARTDEQGGFRVSGLINKRYVVVARTDHGFGRTEGSVLVGLAQHVEGVVVKVHPARRIEGRVIAAASGGAASGGNTTDCEGAVVSLHDPAANRTVDLGRTADGRLIAEGVQPARYEVTVYCKGFLPRDAYDPVVVTIDRDAIGLRWEVDGGARLRGRVATTSGEPVEGAFVRAQTIKGGPRDRDGYGWAKSERDGSYEIVGLRPGTYKVEASAERGFGPRDGVEIVIAAGATASRDLSIDDGGSITGMVVDSEGRGVGGVIVAYAGGDVRALGVSRGDEGKTDATGAFTIGPLRPGDYHVTARRGFTDELRKPGTTDDAKQGERTAVRPGVTTTVRLVVESQSAGIRGSVVDASGAAVSDAFVSAARESDAAGAAGTAVQATRWTWNEHPVLTGTDGKFAIDRLAPGNYTVRAYRRGGGEAVLEHVATSNSAVRLQIKPTGSIAGTVRRDGTGSEDFAISLRDPTSGFRRREQFYRTGGRYLLSDLPNGAFIVTVEATGGTKQSEVSLGEGESKTGVDLTLEGLVTITGRVVELGTQTPVSGIRMFARPARGSGSYAYTDDRANISDEAGRFAIRNVPTGALSISGWVEKESGYTEPQGFRTVAAGSAGTVDIGDIPIQKSRVKPDEPVGDLGIHFAEQPPATPVDQRELRVSFIDPRGPAAKLDIKPGDVLATVDGVDVRGEATLRARPLTAAPPGTSIALGLVRGVTVTVVLAKP